MRSQVSNGFLVACVVVPFLGCGDGAEPARGAPASPVFRMLDDVSSVEIESAIDLTDRAAVLARTHDTLERFSAARPDWTVARGAAVRRRIGRTERPDAEEPAAGVRVADVGDAKDRALRIDGPAAAWRSLTPVPDAGDVATHAVAVRLLASEGAEFRLVVLRVEDAGVDLSSDELVGPLFHGTAPATADLRPSAAAGAGGVVTYRAVHPWLARHRYVLGIVVRSGTVRLLDVERALPDALGAVLDQTRPRGGDSPYRRHVPRGGDVREALVLVAPGRARWGVDVPEGGARLTLALGHLVPERAGRVEVTVQVTARAGTGTSGEVVRLEATLENPAEAVLAGWDDVELDLDPFAGEAAEVVLEARTSGPDEEVAVAFAHPTVVPRRDASRPRPPDVVLVSLDTVRADRVSAYGYPRDTTPALAALSERAAVFTRAIAPAPWTLPSHVTILSGQLPDRHGVRHTSQRIDPANVPLLARELRAQGYRTVAVTGGGYVAPDFGFGEGFEEYRVGDPAPPLHLDSELAHLKSAASRERLEDVLAEPRDRPVFLFAHTYVAHEYHAEVDDLVAVGMAPDEAEALAQDQRWKSLRGRMRTGGEASSFRDELAVLSTRYDAALRAADRLVALVLDASRALERPDGLVLVVLSDHGEELGEHGDFGHAHDLHEELIRVPLLFFGRGVDAGRSDSVVSLADVAPTLRELLGLDPLSELVDGRSLVPALRGAALAPEPALAVSGTPTRQEKHALRGERWKLKVTRGSDGATHRFLYDLEGDGEFRDVAADEPERTESIERTLRARVDALRRRAASSDLSELSPEREAELRALGYLGD